MCSNENCTGKSKKSLNRNSAEKPPPLLAGLNRHWITGIKKSQYPLPSKFACLQADAKSRIAEQSIEIAPENTPWLQSKDLDR